MNSGTLALIDLEKSPRDYHIYSKASSSMIKNIGGFFIWLGWPSILVGFLIIMNQLFIISSDSLVILSITIMFTFYSLAVWLLYYPNLIIPTPLPGYP